MDYQKASPGWYISILISGYMKKKMKHIFFWILQYAGKRIILYPRHELHSTSV